MKFLGALGGGAAADAEDVDERAAAVAHRFEDFPGIAPAVVLDNRARAGAEIGLDPGLRPAGVADRDRDVVFLEAPRQGPLLDDELDLEAGQQDFVEHPDDQFVLTDGQTPHQRANPPLYAGNATVLG